MKDILEYLMEEQIREIASDLWIEVATLLITDASGVYIPQRYCDQFVSLDQFRAMPYDIKKDFIRCLRGDPYKTEWYWESWENLMEYFGDLHQDGDLWHVDYDKLNGYWQPIESATGANFWEVIG